VRRVGVFAEQSVEAVLETATVAELDIVQLAYGAHRERRIGLRTRFSGEIWAVAHLDPTAAAMSDDFARWFDDGIDALVLDAAVPGRLGGTGVALEWSAIAADVQRLRRVGRVILAGGLRPENVGNALAAVRVDAVDVSSGVESAPGIKDPERMRAFAAAVRAHEVR
jgi:phosphoribosylanthranilate isomerase